MLRLQITQNEPGYYKKRNLFGQPINSNMGVTFQHNISPFSSPNKTESGYLEKCSGPLNLYFFLFRYLFPMYRDFSPSYRPYELEAAQLQQSTIVNLQPYGINLSDCVQTDSETYDLKNNLS